MDQSIHQIDELVSKGFSSQQIQGNQFLHTYKLWSKELDSHHIEFVFKAISQHQKNNKQINIRLGILLYLNKLGLEGCIFLTKLSWTNIQVLDLGYNQIGNKGCKQLSKADWPHLVDIDLCGNNIGVTGVKYVTNALWPNLQRFSIWNNKISLKGCEHIVKAKWLRLKEIALWGNNIQIQGCRWLAKKKWSNFQEIGIWNNNIGGAGYLFLKHLCNKIECEVHFKHIY